MKENVSKEYATEIAPVFLGAIGMTLYYFTDGLFIGNALGDDGMSAITISWVIVVFLTAIAAGIGMGGSIRYAVALGKKDFQAMRDYFLGTVAYLLLTSIIITILLMIFYKKILVLLGASGTVLTYCEEYCLFVVYGAFFQIFGLGALPLVRNMGGNRLASAAMGIGYVLNFVLDYVLMFCFPLGMFGCAIAYMSGQVVIAMSCIGFLVKEYRMNYARNSIAKLDSDLVSDTSKQRTQNFTSAIKEITITGIAPFGLYFSQNIVSAVLNKGFIANGGSEALACYTVVIYIAGITNTLHRSVMDGSQPIMSRYHGKNIPKASRHAAILMYLFSAILIGAGALIALVFKKQIAASFGVSDLVTMTASQRLPLYLVGYTCICYSRTTISYLSATDKKLRAGILTYAEPICMVLMISLLPIWYGIDGMWAALISVDILMALTATGMLLFKRKENF